MNMTFQTLSYTCTCTITLSQMTNFGLFQLRVCRRQFYFGVKDREFSKEARKHWEKSIKSNFFFFHSVFRRLVLQTHRKTGTYLGKGLQNYKRTMMVLFAHLSTEQ